MYGKPSYDKRHGYFLIKHPLEFAVHPDARKYVGAHLIFDAMKDEIKGKYIFFVDVFDRRIEWMRDAYFKTGGEEFPYDMGTFFFKSLKEDLDIVRPVYVPTNYVISPYTSKDY